MKNKHWIALLAGLAAVCILLSLPLLTTTPAQQAQVWSDGELLYTLELSHDRTVTVESALGTNVITVRDGAIAVTEADCPDHYCMARGWVKGGAQIVCLPNRLVIRFVGEQSVDGVAG